MARCFVLISIIATALVATVIVGGIAAAFAFTMLLTAVTIGLETHK